MRTILFLLQKEFIQVFRNKTMLPIIFILPLVQLIVLASATTMEIKNLDVFVVDQDLSSTSRRLVSKIDGSGFFMLVKSSFSMKEAEEYLIQDKADLIIQIPAGFEKKLVRENESKIQVILNAINGTVAGIGSAYISSVISDLNKDVIVEWYKVPKMDLGRKDISVTNSYWFNPELNYQNYMVPAILVLLVTIIGMFLSGVNLVREKEMGTTEQINVTPIHKYQFIVGKLLPFWVIALFELGFGLCIGKLIFDIPIVGNLGVLFSVASIYLFVVLGIGLLISTLADTQQQVMFIAFFFLIVFILMSGIFTPTESMPDWAQKLNLLNPIYYFMRVVRMILLKGSGFADIIYEIVSLSVYAVLMLSLAVWRYRKVA
jgi:ABC-2 type transport system permease protein